MNVNPGEPVALSFQVDIDGMEVDTATARMRVVGPLGLIADWSSIEYETTDPGTFNFLVDGAYNVMQPGATREARLIDLEVDGGDGIGIQRFSQDYLIVQDVDELIVMRNSFQPYVQALTQASFLVKRDGWDQADAPTRRSALISAYEDLSHMDFDIHRDYCYGMDFKQRFLWDFRRHIIGNLYMFTPDEFASLPDDFRSKMLLAQVAEADSRLSDNSMNEYRDGGVLMERAGENVTSFRASVPLRLKLNRRTYEILGRYAKLRPRLARL